MKKRITLTIDEAMYRAHGLRGKNVSAYINNILKKEYMASNKDSIVEHIKADILLDVEFLASLKKTLTRGSEDWGA